MFPFILWWIFTFVSDHVVSLEQYCGISSGLAMEILACCIKPSMCLWKLQQLTLAWVAPTHEPSLCSSMTNSLRPSDAYMHQWTNHHWFRWWLVAWSAPSHYLKQWWNVVNWTLRNKLHWNFIPNSNIFIQQNALENVVCEMASILSRPQCVKMHYFLAP